jgi:exopolyphosphatase/guanosine-5'-triphosphate,3'-diphosphate pyrophosphatase
MDGIEPRYEWRIWGDRLAEVAERIGSAGEYRAAAESRDAYLVSRAAADANPKFRNDLLDVKVLRRVEDGFEQWDVACKAEFPIAGSVLSSEVLPLLGVAVPPLSRDVYTAEQLLDEVVGPHPDLQVVTVDKHRRFYDLEGCMAEIADVVVEGRTLQTAAVESADIEALREATRTAGLNRQDNVSYPRAIRTMLGWSGDGT